MRALLAPRQLAHAFIAALGVLAFAGAHRLAYLLEGPPEHGAEEVGHGYLRIVELSAAAFAVATLALFAVGVWRSRAGAPDALLPFRRPLRVLTVCGLGPALIYVVVEFCERSIAAPPTLVLIAGVALQVVLGCAALLGSRRVLHAVRAVARRARPPFVRRRMTDRGRRLPCGTRPRAALVRRANPSRAPPAFA